ncbi:hypothetical protein HYP71_gp001 [Arthrobacter phage KBurrousTX]|uniref:Uncharacterized protein n=1 Tax=Arthrobacter phage KBurrousTX TaxID=2315608 RepID=A0A386K8E5_9CAUD|nr:hypothetical protein HYP71_gp001 [Arthrobacter phage KBurrousTX]AYD81495.1 hypothetical protein KBurrousTX_1 [Arthrobacter phage KBurrousTX]
MRRVCPACSRRTAELIDPECTVCHGEGFLILHPAALTMCEPTVVSEAVGLALESSARLIESTTTLSDNRRAKLAASVSDLVTARIIHAPGTIPTDTPPPPPPTPGRRRRRKHESANQLSFATAEILAEGATKQDTKPYDGPVLEAPKHRYDKDDRPLMRGLPLLSADGHPSHLARIEDPQDAYASTSDDFDARSRRTRQATVLVAAVPHVIAERNRTA